MRSIDSGFFKQLPQLLGRDGHEFSRPFEPAIAPLGGLLERCDLLLRRPVFALRVICGFYLDSAECNDIGATDDPDVVPLGGSIEPAAQIFLRVRDGESLQNVFLEVVRGTR